MLSLVGDPQSQRMCVFFCECMNAVGFVQAMKVGLCVYKENDKVGCFQCF